MTRRLLHTLIAAHIAISVGLLGDSAGFLAVAVRRAGSDDPEFREVARELLGMFALGFGIPLSFLALATGLTLALSTKWRLFHYPWVIVKLGLILSVILVGATMISPVINTSVAEPPEIPLLIGAVWDVVALVAAVALAVFKPGRRIGHNSAQS